MKFDARNIVKAVHSVMGPGPVDMLTTDIIDQEDMDNVTMAVMKDPLGYSYIDEFEKAVAKETVYPHALAVSSGTAALHLALLAAGVKPSDWVITPALTFAGCAAAVRYCGAWPYFVDCLHDPFGMINSHKLQVHLDKMSKSERDRIKAIIAVDLLGYPGVPADLVFLGWPIIEDAAAALGSEAFTGMIATVSFNRNKIATTGGGGVVLCSEDDVAELVRHLATTAKEKSPWFWNHDRIGFNYRMPNICAAMGIGQVRGVNDVVMRKRALRGLYVQAFAPLHEVQIVRDTEGHRSNAWLNCALLETKWASNYTDHRYEVLSALTRAGYGCRAMFTPLHMLEPYKDCPRMADLSVAEDIFNRAICLPSVVNA